MAYEVSAETTKDGLTEECNDLYEVFDSPDAEEDSRGYLWDCIATFRDAGWEVLFDDHDRVVMVDGSDQLTLTVHEVDIEWAEDGAVTVTVTNDPEPLKGLR